LRGGAGRGARRSQPRPALLAAVAFLFWSGVRSAAFYATGIGEQRTIALSDGSFVELNARSRLYVRLTDRRQRDVTLLEGQALFRVAKDAQRPFVVRAGDAQVRAVGTEFDVYKKQSETVVTVVEGRVETYDESSRAGGGAIMLSAGEQLTVLPHTVTKPTRADPSVATAWLQSGSSSRKRRSARWPRNSTATTAAAEPSRTASCRGCDQRRLFIDRSGIADQFFAQPVVDQSH
jgi:ferric-dicitrate binding protein FerR (iron transport regulator)